MEPFTEYCCELMKYYLDERRVGIYYNPIFREYFITMRGLRNGKHVIYHCPWCGAELPESLIDEYYDILKDEFGIHYNYTTDTYHEIIKGKAVTTEKYVGVPDGFKSDWWWRKRGF